MIVETIERREEWDELHRRAPMATMYSQWSWRGILADGGWAATPLGVRVDGRLEAAAFLCRKTIPRVGWVVHDVHRSLFGTALAPARALLAGMRDRAREERSLRLRISPAYPAEETRRAIGSTLLDLLPESPARRFTSEEDGTYWFPVQQPEDEWGPPSWNSHHRRNYRKAERAGVTFREGSGGEAVDAFVEIYRSTYERKGILMKPDSYFERIRVLVDDGGVRVFFTFQGDRVLAGALMGMGRICRYLLGGTLDPGPDVPPVGQVLHFGMMRAARDAGAECYDFGGAPGPTPIDGHPNYGVWRFKHGFGGRHVVQEDTCDLSFHPWGDRLLRWLELRRRPLRPIQQLP